MATAEGTGSIKHLRHTSTARHLVIDRHSGVERDVYQATHVRDGTPPPNVREGSSSGQNMGLEVVVFRVAVGALAEQDRLTGTGGDFRKANAAVKKENAVPAHSVRGKQSLARVAAITAHSIETSSPSREEGNRGREFHHVVRQWI